jgi:hypothetical protein
VSWVERCLGEAACRSSDGAGLPGRRANSSALGSAQVNLGLRLVRATTMGGGCRARRTAAMPSVCSLTGPHVRLTRRATRGRWGIAVFVEGPRNTPCEVASAVIRAPNAPARWAQAVLPGSSGSSWRGSSAGSARGDADAACTAGAILLAGPSQLSFLGCAPLQSGCSGLEVGALVDAASGTRYCIWPFSAQRPPRRLAG